MVKCFYLQFILFKCCWNLDMFISKTTTMHIIIMNLIISFFMCFFFYLYEADCENFCGLLRKAELNHKKYFETSPCGNMAPACRNLKDIQHARTRISLRHHLLHPLILRLLVLCAHADPNS